MIGYVNMSPPNYEKVIDDCTEALKLDINYIKALNRRATALESLERYKEALRGTYLRALLSMFTEEIIQTSPPRLSWTNSRTSRQLMLLTVY